MKFLLSLFLLCQATVFGGDAGKPGPDIAADLKIETKLETPPEILPGGKIGISAILRNSSKSKTWRIIEPGDGSEAGWREPHVYFSVQYFGSDGRWRDEPSASVARCGLFDANWQEDWLDLAPGATLKLKWLLRADWRYELQKPGEYRVRACYDYRMEKPKRAKPLPDAVKNIPPFRIVSRPVPIRVRRPLEIRVKAKKQNIVAGKKYVLSKVLGVELENMSGEMVEAPPPGLGGRSSLRFEVKERTAWRPSLGEPVRAGGAMKWLPPGEKADMLGTGEFSGGLDGTWICPRAGTVNIRAIYAYSTGKSNSKLRSEWTKVEVTTGK